MNEMAYFLIIKKENSEIYIFIYDNQSRRKLLEILSSFASNPDLSFSPRDAMTLAKKVKTPEER